MGCGPALAFCMCFVPVFESLIVHHNLVLAPPRHYATPVTYRPRSHLGVRIDVEDQRLEEPDKLDHRIGRLRHQPIAHVRSLNTYDPFVDGVSLNDGSADRDQRWTDQTLTPSLAESGKYLHR